MPSNDEIRTARAVRYQRLNSQVGTTRHASGETCGPITGALGPPPRPRPRPQNARCLLFSRAGIRGLIGPTTPCDQHTQTIDLAQRISDWEHQSAPNIDRLPMGDKRLWRPLSPIWAPARFPWWPLSSPSPTSSLSSPPPRSPSPPLWRTLPRRAQVPNTRFGDLNLYSTPKSPPSSSTRLLAYSSHFSRTRSERNELLHDTPPVSSWTTQLREEAIARGYAEADIRRERREEDEMTERNLRGILRKKEPQSIFNKNFSFGPKKYKDEDNYLPPLSPRSSSSPFPDLCSQIENRSVKRQRHDSSTADVVAKSSRDRPHSTSSPIPISQPQSKLSEKTYSRIELGRLDVHPGQLVDFGARDRPDAGRRIRNDVQQVGSDHKLSNIMESLKDHMNHDPHDFEKERAPISPLHRPGYYDTHLKGHLMEQSRCKGNLVDVTGKAQKPFNKQASTQTCDLQRKPRTKRDHAPISSNSLTRTTTEASSTATNTTPVNDRARTTIAGLSSLSGLTQSERIRRRSRVPRCRSTDVFLRTIRESRKARKQMRTAGSGSKMEDKLESSDMEDTDWMGGEPL